MNQIQSKEEAHKQDKINNAKKQRGQRNAKIKSLIKETLYNSLAQAIIKIKETLLICVLASSGLCSYLIIELVLAFLSYGVNTTSRTLYETPALFPKITICNVNPAFIENKLNEKTL